MGIRLSFEALIQASRPTRNEQVDAPVPSLAFSCSCAAKSVYILPRFDACNLIRER